MHHSHFLKHDLLDVARIKTNESNKSVDCLKKICMHKEMKIDNDTESKIPNVRKNIQIESFKNCFGPYIKPP